MQFSLFRLVDSCTNSIWYIGLILLFLSLSVIIYSEVFLKLARTFENLFSLSFGYD
jgi:hypothetical protein